MSATTSRLPRSWTTARLEEIGEVITGNTPPTAHPEYYGGEIPFVRPPALKDGPITGTALRISDDGARHARIVPADAVFVSCIGILGKTGIALAPSAFNQQINAIVFTTQINSRYGFYACQTLTLQLEAVASATTVSIVNKAKFAKLTIPVAPSAEQHRIVAEIEKQLTRLNAAVAALEGAQTKLKRYRASVLKAACEGRLVPTEAELARSEGRDYEPADTLLERILKDRRAKWEADQLQKMRGAGSEPKDDRWKAKYKEPVPPDFEGLTASPEGWTWATLDQMSPVFVDCAHRTPKYSPTGFPALRPRDVVNGQLNLDGAARVSQAEFDRQTERRIPQPGDIIYSRELSYGWGVKLPLGLEVCMSQGMALIRPHPELDSDFFLILLNGPVGRRQAEGAATGSAHPHINLGDIKSYTFPLPPTEEQRRITPEVDSRTSVIHHLEVSTQKCLARAERLRQSILKRAFEGKLVPQDPDDEPARVLLERIQSEREQEDADARPKRKPRARSRAK